MKEKQIVIFICAIFCAIFNARAVQTNAEFLIPTGFPVLGTGWITKHLSVGSGSSFALFFSPHDKWCLGFKVGSVLFPVDTSNTNYEAEEIYSGLYGISFQGRYLVKEWENQWREADVFLGTGLGAYGEMLYGDRIFDSSEGLGWNAGLGARLWLSTNLGMVFQIDYLSLIMNKDGASFDEIELGLGLGFRRSKGK